jgi:hypothetical protein
LSHPGYAEDNPFAPQNKWAIASMEGAEMVAGTAWFASRKRRSLLLAAIVVSASLHGSMSVYNYQNRRTR